ncbi:MAG: sulfurtransferase [Candidatus Binatia bacterium]|nr:MAG: sulfurtransferase [Candidatus Binatia bacterium]
MEHSPRFLKLVDEARRKVREIGVEDVRRKIESGESFLLLDVREPEEWSRGHLPEALHLCKGVLERDIERLAPDPDTPIVLYCGGGYRSVLAAESLARMGYRNVASMAGGWRAWTAENYPVERNRREVRRGARQAAERTARPRRPR